MPQKTLNDAASLLSDICFDLEELYGCGDVAANTPAEEIVMGMSPEDLIHMFSSMQSHISKMRREVEFILQNI